jgi:hypothetical protein
MLRWLLLIPLLVSCTPRDPARIGGDPDGVPVAVTVHYASSALKALTRNGGFTRTVVIERTAWPDPCFAPVRRCPGPPFGWAGAGWGPDYRYEPTTTLHLLLGRGPSEGQFLRLELRDGGWSGTVPIKPGTEVVASLQGSGGREGWRELGRFTAAANQRLIVYLESPEAKIETQTSAPQ